MYVLCRFSVQNPALYNYTGKNMMQNTCLYTIYPYCDNIPIATLEKKHLVESRKCTQKRSRQFR